MHGSNPELKVFAGTTLSDGDSLTSTVEVDPSLSPSLLPALKGPEGKIASYELKFLLSHAQAEQVERWASQCLAHDPHDDPVLGYAYRIGSIYFDTDQLDVFNQTATYKRRKFRLRRYGNETNVYLERKTKSADKVSKRRSLIALPELNRLEGLSVDQNWSGSWFHKRVLAKQLKPRCFLSYERVAYIGTSLEGPLRLTLDRKIHCSMTSNFNFELATNTMPLLTDSVILELKYRASLPALFKRLIQELGLTPGGCSKYRRGIAAWGLGARVKEVG
jgi:VTC domain